MNRHGGFMSVFGAKAAPALAASILVAVALIGCAADTGAPPSPTPTATATPTATPTPVPESALDYLMFGDSWPHGAHCPCTPYPDLIAEGLEAELGEPIGYVNRTTNGGTSADLLSDFQSASWVRDDIADAELIVVSTGANDLEPAFEAYGRGDCGGDDGLDCFRLVAEQWRANFDGMLSVVDELRAGEPTATLILTNANEFLADPMLIRAFGREFGLGGGATITAMHHDSLCAAAAAHGATCVDLRPVLNGPDFTTPQNVNTQDAMQRVADAVIAQAIVELGVG